MFKCPWCGHTKRRLPLNPYTRHELKYVVSCANCCNLSVLAFDIEAKVIISITLLSLVLASIWKPFAIITILGALAWVVVELPYVRYKQISSGDYTFVSVPVKLQWIDHATGGLRLSRYRIKKNWVFDVEIRQLKRTARFAILTEISRDKKTGVLQMPLGNVSANTFYLAYKGKRVLFCEKTQ